MSLKQIAELTGVSPATVFRVLNNPDYRCRDAGLRDRIVAADRVFSVSVVMTRVGQNMTDPFFDELLRQIEAEIHRNVCILRHVWYLPIFSDERGCGDEEIKRAFAGMEEGKERPSDGLIIIGKCCQRALSMLKKRYRYVVSVNRNSTNYEVNEVLCDGKKIADMAVEYLISLGHRRIGYVGDCQNEARYRGYLECLKRHGIEPKAEYMLDRPQTEVSGYEAMHDFAKQKEPPTGIYCANDITAVMLYSIGKDSSVMLHLALKAFYPEKPPFPFLHIDTTWKFHEMIEFRDRVAREKGVEMLVYTNEEGLRQHGAPKEGGLFLGWTGF